MTRSALLFFVLVTVCGMPISAHSAPSSSGPVSGGSTETLVLGGGCFWCLEAAFELVPGVLSVESGYAGGHVKNPTYKQVCTGETGHAEVVRIVFDASKTTLQRLFELYWVIHDPTTLNRQGNDVGTQYRSVIFFANDAQKAAAQAAIAAAQKSYVDPIVTQLVPFDVFWRAEDYHQQYFKKNPTQGYCQAVVSKKVDKMKKTLSGEKH